MLRRMWAVYSRVLRETIVDAVDADEAGTISAGLERTLRLAREGART